MPTLTTSPGSGHTRDLSHRLCEVVRDLGAHGWCQGTGGNFSVTLDHDPVRLLLTRSGVRKQALVPRDLLLVDGRGRAVEEAAGRPSAEAILHGRIVAATGAGSVLHVHSVTDTLLGEHFEPRGGFRLRGYEMLKGLEGVTTHETSIFVPVLKNSQDMQSLGEEVASLLAGRPGLHGFLLSGHGLYTWGRTLEEARRHVEIFEFLFECVGRRTSFRPFDGE